MKIFYWLFLNLGLSTVHIIFGRFFVQRVPAENEVSFHSLIASVVALSGYYFFCGERRAWSNVMSEKEH